MPSPARRRIIVTPCVCRPSEEISLSAVLMTCPFLDIAINSSSSPFKTFATINLPVFGVTLAVLIPEPPLF